jgi:AcrB/AcrD/AcrF family
MWIVRLALRRPYSFTVMAILILLVGVITITRMSTDIFPSINIPVVSVIWSYAGVAPEEMEKRALDPQSRTMQVEVQVPNHDGKLYAGMYGQVKILLVDQNAPIVVPATAFLFRKEGPQVATIENKDRIHWQNIRVGRDFGDRIEVVDGLKENSKVVMNPTDDLREGIQVEVKSTEKSKPGNTVAQSTSTR